LFDRATYRRGNLRKSWRSFRKSPVMSREVWNRLKDYNRPDFHPDDRDTTELVERWRAELFGEQGTLNEKLVGSAVA
jgi:predicted metal-dependent hydrolase